MAWVSSFSEGGKDTSTSSGSSVVGSGTANTKNTTWTQMFASTSADAWGFIFEVVYRSSNVLTDDFLFDVGTGAVSSETAIVSNILLSTVSTRTGLFSAFYPIAIPSGSRVAVRCQNSSTSTADICGVNMKLALKDTQSGATSCQTYGANTSDSGATAVDPGGSANTKGTWTEITSSTSATINWLVIAMGLQEVSRGSQNWLLDIGTGAAGAETVLIPDLLMGCSSSHNVVAPRQWSLPIPTVNSGTRLAARLACTSTTSPGRIMDVALYGLNVPQVNGGVNGYAATFIG